MNKHITLILMLLYLAPIIAHSNQNQNITPINILEHVKANFLKVKDYTVNIHAELDMEDINIPPMNVKVYFKQPDKFHLESDGFAMLPREGIFLNPGNFNEENFYMSLLGRDTVNTMDAFKLELVPRKDEIMIRKFTIWVDSKRWTILKMSTVSWQGQSAEFLFEYELIKKTYLLPKQIAADLNLAGFRGFAHNRDIQSEEKKNEDSEKSKRGKLLVQFSDYKINKGIPDSIFEKK